ncbi:hypothetical protein ScPMuIL_006580 [Solemya velum]
MDVCVISSGSGSESDSDLVIIIEDEGRNTSCVLERTKNVVSARARKNISKTPVSKVKLKWPPPRIGIGSSVSTLSSYDSDSENDDVFQSELNIAKALSLQTPSQNHTCIQTSLDDFCVDSFRGTGSSSMTNIDKNHGFPVAREAGSAQSKWSANKKLQKPDRTWSRIKSEKEIQKYKLPSKKQKLNHVNRSFSSRCVEVSSGSDIDFSDDLPDLDDEVPAIEIQRRESVCGEVEKEKSTNKQTLQLKDSKHKKNLDKQDLIVISPEKKSSTQPVIAIRECPLREPSDKTGDFPYSKESTESESKTTADTSSNQNELFLKLQIETLGSFSSDSVKRLSSLEGEPKSPLYTGDAENQTQKQEKRIPTINWKNCLTPIKKAKLSKIIKNEMEKTVNSPTTCLSDPFSPSSGSTVTGNPKSSDDGEDRHFLDSLSPEKDRAPILEDLKHNSSKSSPNPSNCDTNYAVRSSLKSASEGQREIVSKKGNTQPNPNDEVVSTDSSKTRTPNKKSHHQSQSDSSSSSHHQKKHSSSSKKHISSSDGTSTSSSERSSMSGSDGKHSPRKHSSSSRAKDSSRKHSSVSHRKHSSDSSRKHSSDSSRKHSSDSRRKHSSDSSRKHSSDSSRKHSSDSSRKHSSDSRRKHSSDSSRKHSSDSSRKHSSDSSQKHSSDSSRKHSSDSCRKHSSDSSRKHSSDSNQKHSANSNRKHPVSSHSEETSNSERKHSSRSSADKNHSSDSSRRLASSSTRKPCSGPECERSHSSKSSGKTLGISSGKHSNSSKIEKHNTETNQNEQSSNESKTQYKENCEKNGSKIPSSKSTSKDDKQAVSTESEDGLHSASKHSSSMNKRKHSVPNNMEENEEMDTNNSPQEAPRSTSHLVQKHMVSSNYFKTKTIAMDMEAKSEVDSRLLSLDTADSQNDKGGRKQKTHSKKLWNSRKKISDIRSFFLASEVKTPQAFIDSFTRKLYSHYPLDVDALSSSFTQLQINTIDGCFEEGLDFLDHAVNFINDFSGKFRPSSAIINKLIEFGLKQTEKIHLIFKSFETLLYVNRRHPGSVVIDWSLISETMSSIDSGRTVSSQTVPTLVRASLCLQLAIVSLHDDLFGCDVSDPKNIRRSMAYKILSYDSASSNLKQIVTWLSLTLTSGEFEEVRESYLRLHLEDCDDNKEKTGDSPNLQENLISNEVKKLLPLLQKLLELGVQVSSSNMDASKFIASEVLRTYIYLPNLCYRKLLLQTMQSELLKFRLIQLILENHCDQALPCCDTFPESLRIIKQCYFECLPPRNLLTPPTTPQSLDGDNGDEGQWQTWFPPASCEELVMLLYYLTQSYVRCSRKKSCAALRRRATYSTTDLFSLSHIKSELSRLPGYANELQRHLMDITSELTPSTRVYLKLLTCLSAQK